MIVQNQIWYIVELDFPAVISCETCLRQNRHPTVVVRLYSQPGIIEKQVCCASLEENNPQRQVTDPSRVYYQLAHLPTACEKTCKLYSKILTWFRHWYYAVWVCRRVCLPGYFHTLFIGSTRPRCMCVDRPPLSASIVNIKKIKKRLTGEFECRWFTRESTLFVWWNCGVVTDHKLCMRITFYTLQLVGGV